MMKVIKRVGSKPDTSNCKIFLMNQDIEKLSVPTVESVNARQKG